MRRTERMTYYSSNGSSVTLGCSHTDMIWLNDAQGIDGIGAELSTAAGVHQIGDTVVATRVTSRMITLDGKIRGNVDSNRSVLLGALNPLFPGRLVYVDNGYSPAKVRYLDVYIENAPEFSKSNYPEFQVSLYAPYPMWKDGDGTSRKNAEFVAAGGILSASVQNNGDTSSGFEIQMQIGSAQTSINIENSAGDVLSIDYQLQTGDVVTITTGYDNYTAKLIRGGIEYNIFPYVSGTWYEIPTGTDNIQIYPNSGSLTANAFIYWDVCYLGARR